jgi:hypothetical protein
MLSNHFKTNYAPRYLTYRHARKQGLRKQKLALGDPNSKLDVEDLNNLKLGYEQLYSFFIPGLQAGPHTIKVEQPISAGTGKESHTLKASQQFHVIQPRFALPNNAIHSVYPPQGHQDRAEILPHIIFNDPTIPWERIGSPASEHLDPMSPQYQMYFQRNRVPWLAVLTFTQDELKLADSDLDIIFQKRPDLRSTVKQSPTFAINMKMSDLKDLSFTTTPIVLTDDDDPGATSDVIFVPPNLYNSLFTTYDNNGQPTSQTTADVHPYRFLAHRRDITTDGMAVSGASEEDDSGSFGVIFSHRTGPNSLSQPANVTVHLVSIEGVENLTPFPVNRVGYVAISSLYSWNYVCLPPNVPSIVDEFTSVGRSINLLRPSLTVDNRAEILKSPFGQGVIDRLDHGFTLMRYRTQTGETTSCFMRGPFVPDNTPCPLTSWWPKSSNAGTDFQILDQEIGLMDISYSSAWQLGRTMAIADQPFTTALVRVRKAILDRAMDKAQTKVLQKLEGYKTRGDLFNDLPDLIKNLGELHTTGLLTGKDSLSNRWKRTSLTPLQMTYHGEDLADLLDDALTEAALEVASTPGRFFLLLEYQFH